MKWLKLYELPPFTLYTPKYMFQGHMQHPRSHNYGSLPNSCGKKSLTASVRAGIYESTAVGNRRHSGTQRCFVSAQKT